MEKQGKEGWDMAEDGSAQEEGRNVEGVGHGKQE